jgi:hypothetical protein
MSRMLLSLAGFQVITIGRFWVIAEASSQINLSSLNRAKLVSLRFDSELRRGQKSGLLNSGINSKTTFVASDLEKSLGGLSAERLGN